MKLLKTKIQTQCSNQPTQLDLLREMTKRGALDNAAEWQEEFARLKKGVQGEQDAFAFLQKFGEPHWTVLRNVWMNYYGEFEVDIMVFTQSSIYTFEVKNYSGLLEYEPHQCKLNGRVIGQNPFSQTQKAATNLNSILGRKVRSVLLFIGEHNTVQVKEPIAGIQVLARSQFQQFIWQMAQDERRYAGYPLDIDTALEVLHPHEIGKATRETIIPNELKQHLRTGICCCHCGSFELLLGRAYIKCKCGMHESRQEAIVRTICEYGVIFSDRELRTAEVSAFFGKIVSRKTVSRYLNHYFERIGTHKGTEYINKCLPYEKLSADFQFKKKKHLIL